MKRTTGYRSAEASDRLRVSPVLSALLMVSITVVFVAVLGVFSLGFINGTNSSPQATFSTELDVAEDRIIIQHLGGDPLAPQHTSIVVINESTGVRLEFTSSRTQDTFEVGESLVISTSEGTLSGWVLDSGELTFDIRSGVTYTIQIVDTRSQRVIYRTSLAMA